MMIFDRDKSYSSAGGALRERPRGYYSRRARDCKTLRPGTERRKTKKHVKYKILLCYCDTHISHARNIIVLGADIAPSYVQVCMNDRLYRSDGVERTNAR